MTPLRVKKAGRRITPTGCFTAVLLGLALIYGAGAADAADGRHTRAHATRLDRIVLPARGEVVERRQLIVERRGPQVAAGGTVVLRGSRSPVTPNTIPSGSNLNGAGYGSSFVPPGPVLQPGAGWDRELDYGGLDYGGSTPLVVTNP